LQAFDLIIAQDLGRLRKTLDAGNVYTLFPEDSGYPKAAQVYNGRFIVEPIAITYPQNADQVSIAIEAGAEQNIRVVSRSGGHSYIANGLGGKNGSLVVDMSNFSNVTLDSSTNLAIIQPGCRLGDIALALNDYGRAIPHGHCSTVGLGGHAAHGSWGFVSRQWGLTLDHVVSAQLVLANGSITTVSAENNPELFWGVRGSASFGIVTSYEFSTVAIPEEGTYFVYNWNVSVAEASTFLTSLQDFVQSGIPSTLGLELRLFRGNIAGNLSIQLDGAYFGSHDSYTETIQPYLDTLPPPGLTTIAQGNWIETVAALTFGALNTSTQAPINDTFYAKSLMVPEDSPLSKDAIDALMSYLDTVGFSTTDVFWFVEIELYGGSNSAINLVPVDQTAFAHRNKLFNMQLYATSIVPPYPEDGFTFLDGVYCYLYHRCHNFQQPRRLELWVRVSLFTVTYMNYPDNRLDNWQDLYYGSHYTRLQALKKEFDPSNIFSFPLAIEE
ncbi:uncharacterized protein EV420DRAFT_1712324, partial [Desarmillaria tabescens]